MDDKMALKRQVVDELIQHLESMQADDLKPKDPVDDSAVDGIAEPDADDADPMAKKNPLEGVEKGPEEEDISDDDIKKLISMRKGM